MAGQVMFITGGAGGIGSALARTLVSRGDRVALFGRTQQALEALADELGGPNHALAIAGDALHFSNLQHAVEQTLAHWGTLDGLAHCIGSIVLKPLHLTTPEEFAQTINQNLTSAFLAARAVIDTMRARQSGSVVLVSSVAARQGLTNHEAIAAAKAGLDGLVRAAAITYARQSIRFNAVAPGLVETKLAAPLLRTDAARSFSESMHPLGRLGKPEDVAAAIAYLLGPESSWITGQVWAIDGGLSSGYAPARSTHTPPRPA